MDHDLVKWGNASTTQEAQAMAIAEATGALAGCRWTNSRPGSTPTSNAFMLLQHTHDERGGHVRAATDRVETETPAWRIHARL